MLKTLHIIRTPLQPQLSKNTLSCHGTDQAMQKSVAGQHGKAGVEARSNLPMKGCCISFSNSLRMTAMISLT
jgi:hypothetical protein